MCMCWRPKSTVGNQQYRGAHTELHADTREDAAPIRNYAYAECDTNTPRSGRNPARQAKRGAGLAGNNRQRAAGARVHLGVCAHSDGSQWGGLVGHKGELDVLLSVIYADTGVRFEVLDVICFPCPCSNALDAKVSQIGTSGGRDFCLAAGGVKTPPKTASVICTRSDAGCLGGIAALCPAYFQPGLLMPGD